MYEFRGKTALVTGAAKRIGRAVALGLAAQGANIVVHYWKSEEEAKKLQREMTELGVKSWLVSGDLSDLETDKKLIPKAQELAGGLDVLVNSASVFSPNEMDTVELEGINLTMLVNAWAPFLLSRHFAEKTEKGKIINILDTRIVGYDFNHFAYYLSKRMLEILTESMALKLAPRVTVNGIAPGLILPPEGKDYAYLEEKKDSVPLKSYGSVENIVETTVFLLRNDFVTGQVIFVDGGKHLIQTVEGV